MFGARARRPGAPRFFLVHMFLSGYGCPTLGDSRTLGEIPPIRMLDLRRGKPHRLWVAMLGQPVNHRAAGISQAEQFGYFVESLAGCVIASVADIFVRPAFAMLLR